MTMKLTRNVKIRGNLTMDICSITNCSGGAIFTESGNTILSSTNVENCTATESGGGIYISTGNLWLINSTLVDNIGKLGLFIFHFYADFFLMVILNFQFYL